MRGATMPSLSVMCNRDSHVLLCLECGAQLISTGRFCVHIGSDDEGEERKPNVSGDAR